MGIVASATVLSRWEPFITARNCSFGGLKFRFLTTGARGCLAVEEKPMVGLKKFFFVRRSCHGAVGAADVESCSGQVYSWAEGQLVATVLVKNQSGNDRLRRKFRERARNCCVPRN